MQFPRLPTVVLIVLIAAQPAVAEYAITIETVESGTLNQNSPIRLALDAALEPQIAYWVTSWAVRYARKDAGAWTIETAVEGVGANIGFDVDPAGGAHLLYQSGQVPVYAKRQSGAWIFENLFVPTGEWVSSVGDLTIDPQGNARVTYWSMDCGIDCDAHLLYTRKTASNWTTQWIRSCLFNAGDVELDVDASGAAHFTVSCNSDPGATYIGWDAGESRWMPDASAYDPLALALDIDGSPHIVYAGRFGDGLRYLHRPNGVWTTETIDAAESEGGSIAIDAVGEPHVAYQDIANGDLRYAHRAGGVWSYQILDGASSSVGRRASIAVGNDGRVHIAYWDATNSALKYARVEFDPTGLPQTNQTPSALRLFPNPSDGTVRSSFSVKRDGEIDLAVYDASGRRLRTLATQAVSAGEHTLLWDGRDAIGREVAPGAYFLRLTSSSGDHVTERVTIIR